MCSSKRVLKSQHHGVVKRSIIPCAIVMFLGLGSVTVGAGISPLLLSTAQAQSAKQMFTPYGAVRGGASYMFYDDPELTTGFSRDQDVYPYRAGYDNTDAGYMVGFAIGNDFSRAEIPVRIELEYMYRDSMDYELDYVMNQRRHDSRYRMNVQSSTVMLNTYYNFYEEDDWRIWGMGGLGFAFTKVKGEMHGTPNAIGLAAGATDITDTLPERDRTEFAWALGAGASLDVTERLSVDGGYRFVYLGKATSGTSTGATSQELITNITSHEMWLGTRYKF